MGITESRSPSHATPPGSRIGDSRRSRADGAHTAGHVGKAASSPASLKRTDNGEPPLDLRGSEGIVWPVGDSRRR